MLVNIVYLAAVVIALRWIFDHLALRKRFKDIPSPPSFPFIGHLLLLYNTLPSGLYMLWKDNIKLYGKQDGKSMFLFWLGPIPVLSFQSPRHMEALLSSSKQLKRARFYHHLRDWGGEGLFISRPEIWREQRRMLTPTFHVQVIHEFADSISEQSEVLNECIAARLESHPNEPIEVHEYVARCTLETLCETVMGVKLDIQRSGQRTYHEALKNHVESIYYQAVNPWFWTNFVFHKTKTGQKHKKSVDSLHDFADNVIRQRKAERARFRNSSDGYETDKLCTGKKRDALLNYILNLKESGDSKLTDEDIQNHVNEFLFAGHDTTAASVVWTLFLLGNNLDIQDKVHKEIDEVFDNDFEEKVTRKHLDQLKYLDLVIKESLRIYPTAPVIGRTLIEDMWIDGVLIPKNTNIMMLIEQMHNDPAIWENPTKFDPDRFKPENSENRHPYAYIPFSAGPRNCIGQKFSQLFEKMMLAILLRKWNVKSLARPDEITFKWQLSLTPEEPIYFILSPRK